jgi:diaminohydroxyphosphoribosylaminopyrimidine deaminase/5-amino-6-(5-phosphoribosylamino)uracil reductase
VSDELDRRFMAAAILLGATANGTTWPNPAAVGAILVKDNVVVARGRTAKGGRPHAEAAALADAGADASGTTLYVSLEPCAHQGIRGGPCVEAIVAAGVRKVVGAATDPDPRTAGEGFQCLRGAGIDVASGVLGAEARRANPGHHSVRQTGRPYVLLKLAVSADDAVGRAGEAQVAVTGEIARRHVQALRSRFDAIMVGRGTVEADDPALTVRLPGLEHRSPVRVILDSEGRLERDRRIFDGAAPTWVLSASGQADTPVGECRHLAVPRAASGLDLAACLTRLAEEGLTSVLVEGGAKVARALIEADLVDEVLLFRSPSALGGNLVPALAGLPLSTIEASPRYVRRERRHFGPDVMSRYLRAD